MAHYFDRISSVAASCIGSHLSEEGKTASQTETKDIRENLKNDEANNWESNSYEICDPEQKEKKDEKIPFPDLWIAISRRCSNYHEQWRTSSSSGMRKQGPPIRIRTENWHPFGPLSRPYNKRLCRTSWCSLDTDGCPPCRLCVPPSKKDRVSAREDDRSALHDISRHLLVRISLKVISKHFC